MSVNQRRRAAYMDSTLMNFETQICDQLDDKQRKGLHPMNTPVE